LPELTNSSILLSTAVEILIVTNRKKAGNQLLFLEKTNEKDDKKRKGIKK
jgi:hypothetical protein